MVTSRSPFPISLNFSLDLREETENAVLRGDEKLFREGIALLDEGLRQNSVATLRKAEQKFHETTKLEPKLTEAWHAWARTLVLIASITSRHEELTLAKDKIETAVSLAGPKVYWDAALIYQKIGDSSGEIDDLFKAISYFEKAASSATAHEFWNDFGKTYLGISEKLQDIRPVIKAIACYKQGINLSLSNCEGWLGLGRSLKKLYFFTHENDHYTQACDCFAAALQLNPHLPEVWLERIEFMINASLRKKESAKLRVAIEKCELAPTTPRLLAYWAEALALLGNWTDNSELIQEAENKIDEALKQCEEEDLFLINQNGKCLYAFAGYYCDLDLYYQAIEEFQLSLSLDRTQLTCWIWMGVLQAKVYEYTEDVNALERAIHFYSKALQIKTDPHVYYEIAALLIQLGQEKDTEEPIDQALTYLEYLLQTHKSIAFDHPEWFYQYGVALSCKDDPSFHHRALEALVSTLMLSPNYPGIHHQIALIYCHLGDALDDVDYFYRSLHHYKLAARSHEEDETLLIDVAATWMQLSQRATDQGMEESCFKEAEQKLIQAARLGSQLAFYELAALYSLQGSFDLSLGYLHKAYASKNLPSLEDLMDDERLEGVRLFPQFQEFLALLHKR